MGFNLILFGGFSFGKCGKIWKTADFSGRLQLDSGNITQAGLGCVGLKLTGHITLF